MVFLCRGVVGVSGVDFVLEAAEPNFAAIVSYISHPFAGFFPEVDAPIPRGGFGFIYMAVAAILRARRKAEVVNSIIEGIIVFMVNNFPVRGVGNLPVQVYCFCAVFWSSDEADNVSMAIAAFGAPVKIVEAIVNIGVNDCVLAIVEGDFAIWVAVFEFAIKNHRPGTKAVEPFRNVKSQSKFHNPLPSSCH